MRLMMHDAIIMVALVFYARAQEEEQQGHADQRVLSTSQIWGFGILAIVGVSLIGFIAAGLLVLIKKVGNNTCFEVVIKFLFALACGALLGDVFVHILGEAYTSEFTNPPIVSLVLICSIVFFLLLERIFHRCGITHTHWHGDGSQHASHDGHQHIDPISSQAHGIPSIENQGPIMINSHQNLNVGKGTPAETENRMIIGLDKPQPPKQSKISQTPVQIEIKTNQNRSVAQQNNGDSNLQANKKSDDTQTSDKSKEDEGRGCLQRLKGKGTSGYLNLVGSLIHNFIDGIALGVAFATGLPNEFIPVLVAIIAHEVPRELGDVAILLKSNFDSKQTILCNGTVNLIGILGGIIGLAINHLDEGTRLYILVFVGGNFIFVAADIWTHILKSKGWKGNILQAFGFALGVGIMFLLLLLESEEGHAD